MHRQPKLTRTALFLGVMFILSLPVGLINGTLEWYQVCIIVPVALAFLYYGFTGNDVIQGVFDKLKGSAAR